MRNADATEFERPSFTGSQREVTTDEARNHLLGLRHDLNAAFVGVHEVFEFVIVRVVTATQNRDLAHLRHFQKLLSALLGLVAEIVVTERHKRPKRTWLFRGTDRSLPAEDAANQGESASQ